MMTVDEIYQEYLDFIIVAHTPLTKAGLINKVRDRAYDESRPLNEIESFDCHELVSRAIPFLVKFDFLIHDKLETLYFPKGTQLV